MRRSGGRRVLMRASSAVAFAALAAVVATACEPITHPTFTVREGPTSPVAARLLSGDANFVVATATGAGATVPGAGTWRVDRRDGSVVRLPDGYQPVRISNDGARVLLHDVNSHPIVWADGVLLTSPGTFMAVSPDITFGLFSDAAGAVQRWEIATGAITSVEIAPRPPDYTSASPDAISDDGTVAAFQLRRPCCSGWIERFVDLDANTTIDLPLGTGGQGDVFDRIRLSADGSTIVHHHQDTFIDFSQDPPAEQEFADWVEIISLPALDVRKHYDVSANRGVGELYIARDGSVAWITQEHVVFQPVGGNQCGFGTLPTSASCIDASEAVALLRGGGTRRWDTGPGFIDEPSFTPTGRFFAHDRERFFVHLHPFTRGPAKVIDWLTTNVETLSQGVDYETTNHTTCSAIGRPTPCTVRGNAVGAQISNDGRVIVSTSSSGTGWFEFTPAPAP